MQYMPRAYDPSRTSASHTLPMRSQHLQGLSFRAASPRSHKERPQAEALEMLPLQAKDRIIRAQSKSNGLDLHLHKQQVAPLERVAANKQPPRGRRQLREHITTANSLQNPWEIAEKPDKRFIEIWKWEICLRAGDRNPKKVETTERKRPLENLIIRQTNNKMPHRQSPANVNALKETTINKR